MVNYNIQSIEIVAQTPDQTTITMNSDNYDKLQLFLEKMNGLEVPVFAYSNNEVIGRLNTHPQFESDGTNLELRYLSHFKDIIEESNELVFVEVGTDKLPNLILQ